MKIVYFYQLFSTPKGAWGTRVYEFTRNWVEQGHEVTVVSSIYSKSDLKASRLVEDQYFDGVHVKVLNIKLDNKQPFYRRTWSFLQYSILSSYFALTLKADVVIASSGPLTVGIPGLLARYVRGRKLVFEVRDLWPSGAIELGIIKNYFLKKLSFWLEKQCYRASSYIVTLSPGMTQDIKRRYKVNNIEDVTNAANIKLFSTPLPCPNNVVEPNCYAIYAGNIGMANNSYWLYEAAKSLQRCGREDIKILMVGDGQQREELGKIALKEGVTNFILLDLMPKERLVGYLQHAFASVVAFKEAAVLDTCSPNKFFESLAAGVPIVQNTQGWMKRFLEEHEVGLTLSPNNPDELAQTLIWMRDSPTEVERMRLKAASIAKQYFDKDFLANKMLKIIQGVSESPT